MTNKCCVDTHFIRALICCVYVRTLIFPCKIINLNIYAKLKIHILSKVALSRVILFYNRLFIQKSSFVQMRMWLRNSIIEEYRFNHAISIERNFVSVNTCDNH